ncbi:WSC domain-containing protein 2 [Gracilinanus agilis]|uniref:WSC domain-containing protein 2 n=1 Tax=Gracilinanus agilis TaxID=191870 RepID=UPI001CFD750D|nr:WSC domain-containing protein 2 [Gracilinanus agilis]
MAKLWVKFQRYFRRTPVRFFTLVALYLTAGSLVFLHSGFVGQPAVAENEPNPAASAPEGAELPYQDLLHLERGFRETPESPNAVRRYGPWLKSSSSKDSPERGRLGDYGGTWSRALKGRVIREKEEEKAKYVGCYLDNPSRRALRGLSFFDYKKMTVFRCQDSCAERGYLYAGLEFGAECFCGHKIQGANASQAECNMECKGEKNNICGGVNRLSIYRLELAQESARRYGSAIFRGCFHRPDNLSLALPVTATMLNMSVDKCVDFCTEKLPPPEFGKGDAKRPDPNKYGNPDPQEWPEFVKNYAPWWATHTLDWLKYGKKVLVVHFEDLKQDLFTQLERMVSLLDVDVFEDRLLCVEGQKDGNFKRSGLRKLEYDPYTPEMQNTINSYIKMVDRALKLRNLTGVPDDYYPR